MEFLEIILGPIIDFVVYGSMNTTEDKRAPLILRILAALFLGVLFFGLPLGFLIAGIVTKEPGFIWGGSFLLIVSIPLFIYIWRFERHDNENK